VAKAGIKNGGLQNISSGATQWELRGYKRKPGRPRIYWMDIVGQDLKDMGTTWDKA